MYVFPRHICARSQKTDALLRFRWGKADDKEGHCTLVPGASRGWGGWLWSFGREMRMEPHQQGKAVHHRTSSGTSNNLKLHEHRLILCRRTAGAWRGDHSCSFHAALFAQQSLQKYPGELVIISFCAVFSLCRVPTSPSDNLHACFAACALYGFCSLLYHDLGPFMY